MTQLIVILSPGFPLYEVLAKGQGINVKYYDLSPDYVRIKKIKNFFIV